MFNYRAIYAKLSRNFENALRLVCKSSESKPEHLDEKCATNHQHNLQLLVVEVSKAKNNRNAIFIENAFTEKDSQFNLRSKNHSILLNFKTEKSGIEIFGIEIFGIEIFGIEIFGIEIFSI